MIKGNAGNAGIRKLTGFIQGSIPAIWPQRGIMKAGVGSAANQNKNFYL